MIIDTTGWHWQQWYFIVVWALMIPCAPMLHGKARVKFYGFYLIINAVLSAYILISGGFFHG